MRVAFVGLILVVVAACGDIAHRDEEEEQHGAAGRAMGRILTGALNSLTGGSLKGDTGPTGPTGPPGAAGATSTVTGDKGDKGDKGAKGQKGAAGEKGATGAKGSDGPSGPTTPGPKGAVGPDGSAGGAGTKGSKGNKGDQGVSVSGPGGDKGEPGATGPSGRALYWPGQGRRGVKGEKGEMGRFGKPGSSGLVGPTGPPRLSLGFDVSEVEHLETDDQMNLVLALYRKLDRAGAAGDGDEVLARTCRDLAHAMPERQSGEYWIDPNGGDAEDAIFVHCDMGTKATCIRPALSASEQVSFEATGDRLPVWVSDIPKDEGGFEPSYEADTSQISFLQLLSNKASQNLTYHCFNSVAYFDARTGDHQNAIRLMSWNDRQQVLGQFKPSSVPLDECQHAKRRWAKTVFEVKDAKPFHLPIVDVAVKDVGSKKKKFNLEVGPVCYY